MQQAACFSIVKSASTHPVEHLVEETVPDASAACMVYAACVVDFDQHDIISNDVSRYVLYDNVASRDERGYV